ncbi:hypothetical protein RD792_008485 [Penstemon davidsonii]|uniref:Uncharacterized protein n=1 Tax=Penstemon davidsonii TaxID=160366 RepID=A0ABR0D989_9LAMI|nr:hypothetical protein RD792_008485 [Penstemon davidsonii]
MQSNRHTIILMQPSQHRASRTFMDYDSISQAMDGMYQLIVKFDAFASHEKENLKLLIMFDFSYPCMFGSLCNQYLVEFYDIKVHCYFSTFTKFIIFFSAGICGLYERKIKELNPAIRNMTYDISDLYNFIDGLTDLSALV